MFLASLLVLAVIGLLVWGKFAAEYVFWGAVLTFVSIGNSLALEDVLGVWSHPAVIVVVALVAIARLIEQAGILRWLDRFSDYPLRLLLTVAAASPFTNNTPLVAATAPLLTRTPQIARQWLLPLSYVSILAGSLTLIGTSTNYFVGSLAKEHGLAWSLWAPLPVAGPLVLVALMYVLAYMPRRLRASAGNAGASGAVAAHLRIPVARWQLGAGHQWVGHSLRETLFQDGHGLAPIAIQREHVLLEAPPASTVLVAGDILILRHDFAEGMVESPALVKLPECSLGDIAGRRGQVVNVVVTRRCPLAGTAVGGGAFRDRYGAAVVRIERGGVAVDEQDWRLEPGDLLSVQVRPGLFKQLLGNRELVVVGTEKLPPSSPATGGSSLGTLMKLRRAAAVCIAILTVVALAAGFVSASLVAVTGLVFIGALLRPRGLVGVIDFGLAATLAGALAFGLVLQSSGLVEGVAETVIGFAGGNALLMLIALGVCTGICTELVSNIAAAAMMAPLGFALAEGSAVSTEAATMTVMLAASASFATPFGYQTNLMVAGPGGYRYGDFIRCGLTLNIWFAVGAAVLSYWYFPALVF